MLMKVTDANSVTVFDPRGVVESANTPIAARPKSLDGLRLAILDNSKWNANKVLRASTAALEKSIKFGKVNYYVKGSFSKDAEPELIAEIAANNDLVLTAIGDCGSCCSCSIRDSVALEKLGIPSAAIITTEFEKETVLTRTAIGMEGLIGRGSLGHSATLRFPSHRVAGGGRPPPAPTERGVRISRTTLFGSWFTAFTAICSSFVSMVG